MNRKVTVSLVRLNKDGGREIDASSSSREEEFAELDSVINSSMCNKYNRHVKHQLLYF